MDGCDEDDEEEDDDDVEDPFCDEPAEEAMQNSSACESTGEAELGNGVETSTDEDRDDLGVVDDAEEELDAMPKGSVAKGSEACATRCETGCAA